MRSISIKLTLAFVLVSLTGILLMGWLVRARTLPRIAEFNNSNRQAIFIDFAKGWYARNQSWDGIERAISSAQNNSDEDDEDWRRFGRGVVLTDSNYTVVFGRGNRYDSGDRLRSSDQERVQSIEVQNQVVGYVVFQGPNSGNGSQNNSASRLQTAVSPEQIFLNQFESALLLGAGVAIGIALLVGAFLAGTLSILTFLTMLFTKKYYKIINSA